MPYFKIHFEKSFEVVVKAETAKEVEDAAEEAIQESARWLEDAGDIWSATRAFPIDGDRDIAKCDQAVWDGEIVHIEDYNLAKQKAGKA